MSQPEPSTLNPSAVTLFPELLEQIFEEVDTEMDRLRRSSFKELFSNNWDHGVEAAVDIALLGRYYERIADHAVSIARRVVFLVTGEKTFATPH